MDRIVACLIGVAVAALPLVADARGSGGGHCASGSRGGSSSHKSSHPKGAPATVNRASFFNTFFLYGASSYAGSAGYVQPTQEEAPPEPQPEFRNDCPPDMDCKPSSGPSAG